MSFRVTSVTWCGKELPVARRRKMYLRYPAAAPDYARQGQEMALRRHGAYEVQPCRRI
jgi:hypothetical protein